MEFCLFLNTNRLFILTFKSEINLDGIKASVQFYLPWNGTVCFYFLYEENLLWSSEDSMKSSWWHFNLHFHMTEPSTMRSGHVCLIPGWLCEEKLHCVFSKSQPSSSDVSMTTEYVRPTTCTHKVISQTSVSFKKYEADENSSSYSSLPKNTKGYKIFLVNSNCD